MKNKNIIMYIVIILILGGVIALGMYAKEANKNEDNKVEKNTINQNINNKNQNTPEKDKKNNSQIENKGETKKEKKELSENEIIKLSKKVIGLFNGCVPNNERDVFRKLDMTSVNSLDQSIRLSLVAKYIYASSQSNNYFTFDKTAADQNKNICGVSYISEDKIKKIYYDIFGENAYYQRASFNANQNDYNWSDTNNRYEATVYCGKGGACPGGSVSKFAYSKQVDNDIEIYEYYAYIDIDYPKYDIYADYNKQNLITSDIISYDEIFNKYKNEVGLYKYIFKYDEENNHYYFDSVEKVK